MRRAAGALLQIDQHLFILVNLTLEVFLVPLVVDIQRNFIGAFLLNDRHSSEALISQIKRYPFGNIGMMSGTRCKYHRIIVKGVFDIGGNVDNPQARQVEKDPAVVVGLRPILFGKLFGKQFDKFQLTLYGAVGKG